MEPKRLLLPVAVLELAVAQDKKDKGESKQSSEQVMGKRLSEKELLARFGKRIDAFVKELQ